MIQSSWTPDSRRCRVHFYYLYGRHSSDGWLYILLSFSPFLWSDILDVGWTIFIYLVLCILYFCVCQVIFQINWPDWALDRNDGQIGG